MADCHACLIAGSSSQYSTLETMAARTGFGELWNGFDSWQAARSGGVPIPFFFFHYRLDEEVMLSTLARLRGDPEENVRFSPAIAVVGTCSEQEVIRFIQQGFDDIVVLPESPRVLRSRFAAQLDTPITYFETSTYFGPDRRRAARDPAALRRATGPSEHVRYLIRRAPEAGIRVLKRDVIVSAGRKTASSGTSATLGMH